MSPRQWARDLAMGARFAVTGGREGWVRTTLTAVGVGLGVLLLLLCTAVPNVMASRSSVEDARYADLYSPDVPPRADNTLLIADADTTWHDDDVRGRFLEPEGTRAPLPPGVDRFPGKGEMVVSPALEKLLTGMPRFALALIDGLIAKGKCYSSMAQILGTRSVIERLAQFLLTLSELHGVADGDTIIINRKITHDQIAAMVGSTRQWVTMMLKRFHAKRIVSIDGGVIRIHRLDQLEQILLKD